MKKLGIVLLVLSLGACAEIQKIESSLTGATVSPTAVYIASNAFDALEATATNYLSLPKCGTGICRNAAATAQIIPAIRSGRVARNNLRTFLKTNPGQLGPAGDYAALQSAVDTLKAIFANYNIGG